MKSIFHLVVFFLLIGCGSDKSKDQNSEQGSNNTPHIKLTDLKGNPVDLSAFGDKKIFINFWATWCAPCIREMPSLQKMQEQLHDEPVVFFYASDEPLNRIKAFREKKKLGLNFVHLDDNLENLNVYALPTTFIIDARGKVIFKETGSRDWSSDKSIKEIKKLL